jgi:hypothetical protein
MTFNTFLILLAAVIVCIVGTLVFIKKWPRKLKPSIFLTRWKSLQVLCKDKSTWPEALSEADILLDKALRRRKYKGKSMGERLVSAQRSFTNNDAVWFAHNMCKKVLSDPDARLREDDVKAALIGFRQALRDLGALPSNLSQEARADDYPRS